MDHRQKSAICDIIWSKNLLRCARIGAQSALILLVKMCGKVACVRPDYDLLGQDGWRQPLAIMPFTSNVRICHIPPIACTAGQLRRI